MKSTYNRRHVLRAGLAGAAATVLAGALPGTAHAAPAESGPVLPGVPGMLGNRKYNEFWYQYDERFWYHPSPEAVAAFKQISEALGGKADGSFYGAWKDTRAAGTYPQAYLDIVAPAREPLATISRLQLNLFDEFFRYDPIGLVNAFVDFGQGVLYDPRREVGYKLHIMDYEPGVRPAVGYHVWHSIIQAMSLLDIDRLRWRLIDPVIGLGWAVQSIAQPAIDATDNPRLSARRIADLERRWLPRTTAQLDTAFDSFPYPSDI
ncbi:hypothetical protein [Dactylosporangium sp. NPDC051541]|uniref:hypothetical protein n=1 Tax=Dactylosporangium sp. NPDC051541 TaxID=3363977 RepID=UPI00379545F7